VSWVRIVVGLLAVLAGAGDASAGGFGVVEFGMRRTAMGAVIGRPDDPSAIYHNPAGLILTRGTSLYLASGLMLPRTDFLVRPWSGSERYLTDPVDASGYYPPVNPDRAFAVIPMIAASTDLGRDDLALGLALYFPNAVGGSFREDSVARYHLISSYVVGAHLTAAVAYRPHRVISLGVAGSMVYIRSAGERHFYPSLGGLDLGGLLGSDATLSVEGADWQGMATLSLLFTPHPRLSFGAAVLTRVDVALEGELTLRSGSDALTPFTWSGTHRTELLFPWTIHLGLNVDVLRWLELGLELRYYLYSQFVEQRTTIEGIPFLTELVVPKNYHDSVQASGGFRATLSFLPRLEVMLGLHYDRTPAPSSTVSLDQPSFNHLGLHSGLRYRLGDRLRLSLSYAHYFYLERGTDRSVQQSPPSNYRASGHGELLTIATEIFLDPRRVPR
jgi:long-subunit fatty acid transport protein